MSIDAEKSTASKSSSKSVSPFAAFDFVHEDIEDGINEVGIKGFFKVHTRILGTTEGHWFVLCLLLPFLLTLGTLSWMHLTPGDAAHSTSLNDSFWITYMLMVDVGTQTGFSVNDPTSIRWNVVIVSLIGFVFWLIFLGMLVELIRSLMEELKAVHNRFITRDHILVLGWGHKTLFLLGELIKAEESARTAARHLATLPFKDDSEKSAWAHDPFHTSLPDRRRCCRCCRRRRKLEVIVLADRPVREMKQLVRMHFHFTHLDQGCIKFRQGSPTDRTELMKVSAASAHTILVMRKSIGSEHREVQGSEHRVIESLLALGALPTKADESRALFAEVRAPEEAQVISTILPKAMGISPRTATRHMLVLRTLVPSVGYAYMQLSSCLKDYSLRWIPVPPVFQGTDFISMRYLLPGGVICGVRSAPASTVSDAPCTKEDYVPSSAGRTLERGDEVLILSRRSMVASAWDVNAPVPPMRQPSKHTAASLHTADGQLKLGPSIVDPKVVLLLGCPDDVAELLAVMKIYLAAGSEIHVLSTRAVEWREQVLEHHSRLSMACQHEALALTHGSFGRSGENCLGRSGGASQRVKIVHHVGLTTDPADLLLLPIDRADCAMIVSEQTAQGEAPIVSDAKNLSSVILLRSVLRTVNDKKKKVKVVTELVDAQSEQVLQKNSSVRKTTSMVFSSALEAGIFATAASEKKSYDTVMELLDPHDDVAHIAVVPAAGVVTGSESLSYMELSQRVFAAGGGVLLGWRRPSDMYPLLNPMKKEEKLEWDELGGDEFIVLRSSAEPRSIESSQDRDALHETCGGGAVAPDDANDTTQGLVNLPGCTPTPPSTPCEPLRDTALAVQGSDAPMLIVTPEGAPADYDATVLDVAPELCAHAAAQGVDVRG
jgi:hypothetical protein